MSTVEASGCESVCAKSMSSAASPSVSSSKGMPAACSIATAVASFETTLACVLFGMPPFFDFSAAEMLRARSLLCACELVALAPSLLESVRDCLEAETF